jgi:2-polyprenyl-3-methyl-5-hydroxy-6-metoxy-1,4-benzoquinol methylase
LSSPVLDLGFAPPSNSYLSAHQLNEPETYLPLRARFCDECKLMQLEDYSDPRQLFTPDYAYRSGTSQSWLKHVASFADSVSARLGLDSQSLVVEIGCNDGHLLRNFARRGIPCLGIEPAAEAAQAARQHGIDVIEDFFSARLAGELARREVLAELVVADNVFAHVPDINDFATGLSAIMKPEGTLALEFPHVENLVRYGQFDTIYHEHYSYLSLTSASHILERAGLEVFDVEQLSTHGGSLRVYSHHHGGRRTEAPCVRQLLQSEIETGLMERESYARLQARAERIKDDLLTFLLDAKRAGKRVAAYGAAAKGSTLLNFAGVKPDLLPVVYDAAPSKQGKYLPGSHIPIRPPSSIDPGAWDYVLILPWNIADEVVSQLGELARNGIAFLVAVPELAVLPNHARRSQE